MANGVYNMFKKGVMAGTYGLDGGAIYCSLVGSNYTFNAAHDYLDDIGSEIVTPSNGANSYALSSPVVTTNGATAQGVFDAADFLIANVTFGSAVNAAVLFQSDGAAAASPLICYVDFGSNQSVTAGTFQIQWAAGGIVALT